MDNMTWESICEAIASIYGHSGEGTKVAEALTNNGIAVGDVEGAFKMLEGTAYEIWYNKDGSVRSYNYVGQPEIYANTNAAGVTQLIDSNTQVATKASVKIPLNTTPSVADPTKTTFGAGMKQAGNFVLKEVVPAIAAANVGITLGKAIDSALYNANPDFWDSHDWGSINPETWATITQGDDSLNATLFNTIFKIDPQTNTSQAYMDENAVAYLALVLQQLGAFNTGSVIIDDETITRNLLNVELPFILSQSNEVIFNRYNNTPITYTFNIITGDPKITFWLNTDDTYSGSWWFQSLLASSEPFTYRVNSGGIRTSSHAVINNKDVYYTSYYEDSASRSTGYFIGDFNRFLYGGNYPANPSKASYIAYTLIYGTTTDAIEGISTQSGATTPQLSNDDTVADVLAKLQAQYPDLFTNAISQDVIQPDGSVTTYTYLPVGQVQPNPNPTEGYTSEGQPISASSTQADPEVDPETAPEEQLAYLIDVLTSLANPNIENTGDGNTPSVIIPTGSANALYTVYNPTESEIQSFGGWLWSANFVDQLLKMFNDPMQAIISLHKVFCTPATSGRNDIKVGYLNSGVQANVVSSQYVDVDLGSVSLNENYRNVFDYPPYTEVSLYLPFVGFVRLDVNDIMRSSINVKYHIDVLTGACLAEVKVTRDSFGGTLYQYAGDCSVHSPFSSGSYMGVVSALLGVAGTIASGGALAPMALGAAGGVMGARSSIERSGGLAGNAGAMGIKKPYLVIQRPQTNMPMDFETFLGKPSYSKVKISECSGFIKCTEVHALNTPATESELNELIAQLKEGVIL